MPRLSAASRLSSTISMRRPPRARGSPPGVGLLLSTGAMASVRIDEDPQKGVTTRGSIRFYKVQTSDRHPVPHGCWANVEEGTRCRPGAPNDMAPARIPPATPGPDQCGRLLPRFPLDDFRLLPGAGGTLAPFSRASLRPIAIACLRLVTF